MFTPPPSVKRKNQIAGFLVVALTMIEMFTIPKSYFVLGSLVSTSAMICVAYFLLQGNMGQIRPNFLNLGMALVVAILLYLIFFAGNVGIKIIAPFGISSSNEQGIYGLFSNVKLPILVLVLVLDSVGFESYFRGNILRFLSQEMGIWSVVVTATIDASIHFSAFNLLFPATTFIADCVWGLYYFKTRDLSSTILCHFVWDIMIFVLIPIH
jgi:CAAX protease family protein